jgi:hypothetical protein
MDQEQMRQLFLLCDKNASGAIELEVGLEVGRSFVF